MSATGPSVEPQPSAARGAVGTAGDRLVLGAVVLALFMAALEQTIIGPTLPDMGRSLGDVNLIPWVATGYLLAATATGPVFGALADAAGRRPALYLALFLFVAGSVGAALAPDIPLMIAARVLQGAGAGGLVSLPFVVIADKVPMSRRAAYSAVISSLYAVAGLSGPTLGGLLTEYLHWSLIFWINLPLGIIVFAVVIAQPREVRQSTRRSIDLVGAALLLVASTASILALQSLVGSGGSILNGLISLVVGIVAWSLFGWQIRRAERPLVPIGILTEPTILLCTLGLLCTQGAYLGLSLYVPFYYQQQLGMSASQAGFAVLSFVGGAAVGAYLPARWLIRDPRYKAMSIIAGSVAFLGSLGVIAALAAPPSIYAMIAASVLMGLGVGALYPTFTIATQNAARRDQIGAATGMLSFTRSMGGVIGVAVTGMVAIASGLTGDAHPASLPIWLLGAVPSVMLLVCLIAMALLPVRQLEYA